MRTDTRLKDYDRVRHMTTDSANQKIDVQTQTAIDHATARGRAAVERRLTEIQQEWDVDRVLILNFSVLVFAQLLAARKDRRWLWGPLIQTPLLLMHATLGWCPPVLWFRPMGFRTRSEIQAERESLLKHLSELPT
jgi:hypothetical protein